MQTNPLKIILLMQTQVRCSVAFAKSELWLKSWKAHLAPISRAGCAQTRLLAEAALLGLRRALEEAR